ncbi:hypothetical protein GC098_28510 [Paenibacillus sp. LMG 31458]|uniref:Uncharacterized protein n=1 Tax=Paenibacillus phytorum TaxID=2654977 RepID=A0ABX1Y3D9_9BACL|nr:hypothetical protein [Paenibacillus phytorum]
MLIGVVVDVGEIGVESHRTTHNLDSKTTLLARSVQLPDSKTEKLDFTDVGALTAMSKAVQLDRH